MSLNRGSYTSKTSEWGTPQRFFDILNVGFCFTLDVCAGPTNHKCSRYFTKEQDGLAQDWSGQRCWMNPPYGREIVRWVKKAAESGTLVVGLLPARTDTVWFHTYVLPCAQIRFIKGRIHFVGYATDRPPYPSLLAIWGA